MAKQKETPQKVDSAIEDFFTQYPKAPSVLKVGDCLFLPIHKGSANDFARRNELEVEEIANPNLKTEA